MKTLLQLKCQPPALTTTIVATETVPLTIPILVGHTHTPTPTHTSVLQLTRQRKVTASCHKNCQYSTQFHGVSPKKAVQIPLIGAQAEVYRQCVAGWAIGHHPRLPVLCLQSPPCPPWRRPPWSASGCRSGQRSLALGGVSRGPGNCEAPSEGGSSKASWRISRNYEINFLLTVMRLFLRYPTCIMFKVCRQTLGMLRNVVDPFKLSCRSPGSS